MQPRTLALVIALLGFAAQAQNSSSCEACAAGAQCISGACQFTCAQDLDCREGRICIGGLCEERLTPQLPGMPPMKRRGDATHPDRFRMSGTAPPGFHVVQQPSWGLVGGGIAAFASAYLPVAISGLVIQRPLMAIPFAGPIFGFSADAEWFVKVVFAVGITIDIAVQLAGLCMIVAGFRYPVRWLERDPPKISFVPFAGGASLAGRF